MRRLSGFMSVGHRTGPGDCSFRLVADMSRHGILAAQPRISMLITLAKRYHRWLCETGAKTDVKKMTTGAPTAGLPWVIALGLVLAIFWLVERLSGQSLWFGPPYIRWVLVAANLVLVSGWVYATFTVFICSWRAEARKLR